MPRSHYQLLLEFYKVAYNSADLRDFLKPGQITRDAVVVSPTIHKFSSFHVHGQVYRCAESQSQRGAYIQVLFASGNDDRVVAWPGQVLYYFSHVLRIGGQDHLHTFAVVQWFQESGNRHFEEQGLAVWKQGFRELQWDSILPIQRIYSR